MSDPQSASQKSTSGNTIAETYYANSSAFLPFEIYKENDYPAPPGGSCCLCDDKPRAHTWYTDGMSSTELKNFCNQAESDFFTQAGMMAVAESGQTCTNACEAKLDSSMKQMYQSPDEGETNPALSDMCICNPLDASDYLSYKDKGVTDMTMATFNKWQAWQRNNSLDLNDAGILVGITEEDGKNGDTCAKVCSTVSGKPQEDGDEVANIQPILMGLPRSSVGTLIYDSAF